jgi:hypothetical protein
VTRGSNARAGTKVFAERAVAAVVWELVAVDIGRLSNQESG